MMEKFFSIVAISLVGVAFWQLAGIVADFVTSLILKRTRRKKSYGKQPSCCPMFDCKQTICGHFDPDCLACEFTRKTGLNLEDPEDV